MNGPDGKRFVWGQIIEIHRIGDYYIVEYRDKMENDILFHPYVNVGTLNFDIRDTCAHYRSLDTAILGAMAYKMQGPNSQAAFYACKVLGFSVE